MGSATLLGGNPLSVVLIFEKKIPTQSQVLQGRFIFTQGNKCCDVDYESEFDKFLF